MTPAEIEAKARRIGARRRRHAEESDVIQGQVAEIVEESEGVISRERLAELLGMHRSSLYELFIGGSDDDGDRAAAASGAAKGQ